MLFHEDEEPTPPKVTEVVNYLDMWRFIERSFHQLSDPDKQRLAEEAGVFGVDPKFRGFDGNNEGEYMNIARFMIEDLNRFAEFAERDLNSHFPMVSTYRRMFGLFEPMRRKIGHHATMNSLGVDDLIQLLKRS